MGNNNWIVEKELEPGVKNQENRMKSDRKMAWTGYPLNSSLYNIQYIFFCSCYIALRCNVTLGARSLIS